MGGEWKGEQLCCMNIFLEEKKHFTAGGCHSFDSV